MEVQGGGPAATHTQGAGGERGTGGKRSRRKRELPDRIAFAIHPRTVAAVEAAQDASMPPVEWLQGLVRRGIDAACRARTRPGILNARTLTLSGLAVIALAGAAPLSAQVTILERARERRERFELFNQCASMHLLVFAAGLTEVSTMVESRFRAERLYSPGFPNAGAAVLTVNANVFRDAYAYRVTFEKSLTDEWGFTGHAPTYDVYRFYVHWGDGGMRDLTEAVETFIGDYLRVNAEACQ